MLLDTIEHSPFGKVRGFAAHGFDWQPDNQNLLIKMLSDSSTQVRFSASLGLRKLKPKDFIPAILECLEQEQDENVFESLIHLLGEIGDPAVVSKLLDLAQSANDFYRLEAIEALARIGEERAIPIAIAMLSEHRPPEHFTSSGGKTHSKTISELVRISLADSPQPELRKLAKPPKTSSWNKFWQ